MPRRSLTKTAPFRSRPGRAVYFAQMIDRDGNASPLAQVGQCVNLVGDPARPRPAGAEIATRRRSRQDRSLSWFCPPVGVERFEVFIEPQQAGAPPPTVAGFRSRRSLTSISAPVFDPQLQSRLTLYATPQFFTGRVGTPAFQPGTRLLARRECPPQRPLQDLGQGDRHHRWRERAIAAVRLHLAHPTAGLSRARNRKCPGPREHWSGRPSSIPSSKSKSCSRSISRGGR